jgi:NADPH-dependent 2,4-dienoyl-CoA reductase/sulfur reductase-like enzyme
MKAVIIGGVAAGMSAASKLKRLLPLAEVTVYERGNFLS